MRTVFIKTHKDRAVLTEGVPSPAKYRPALRMELFSKLPDKSPEELQPVLLLPPAARLLAFTATAAPGSGVSGIQ